MCCNHIFTDPTEVKVSVDAPHQTKTQVILFFQQPMAAVCLEIIKKEQTYRKNQSQYDCYAQTALQNICKGISKNSTLTYGNAHGFNGVPLHLYRER